MAETLVSVLGDSISTYEGYNPEDYEVFYEGAMRDRNGLLSVDDTWWAQVIDYLDGTLCVNDSYSGSLVSGCDFPSASCPDRIKNLKRGKDKPEIILIYIGCNDYGYGVPPKFDGMDLLRKKDLNIFADAYEYMLEQIKKNYPEADVVCGTLLRSRVRSRNDWTFPEKCAGYRFDDYNEVIRKVTLKEKCCLADIAAAGVLYETLDGAHPTKEGHKTIADLWIREFQK